MLVLQTPKWHRDLHVVSKVTRNRMFHLNASSTCSKPNVNTDVKSLSVYRFTRKEDFSLVFLSHSLYIYYLRVRRILCRMQSDRRRDSVLSLEVPVLLWQTLGGLQCARCVQTDSGLGLWYRFGWDRRPSETTNRKLVCERNIILIWLKVTDVML